MSTWERGVGPGPYDAPTDDDPRPEVPMPAAARYHELVGRLYDFPTCGVGGPLHIVTDDGNVLDENLDFCEGELVSHWSIDEATPEDAEAIRAVSQEIIDLLRSLTVEQRKALVR